MTKPCHGMLHVTTFRAGEREQKWPQPLGPLRILHGHPCSSCPTHPAPLPVHLLPRTFRQTWAMQVALIPARLATKETEHQTTLKNPVLEPQLKGTHPWCIPACICVHHGQHMHSRNGTKKSYKSLLSSLVTWVCLPCLWQFRLVAVAYFTSAVVSEQSIIFLFL